MTAGTALLSCALFLKQKKSALASGKIMASADFFIYLF